MAIKSTDFDSAEFKPRLYEVAVRNRVVKAHTKMAIRGRQGNWYYENLLVLSRDEAEVKRLVTEEIESRTIFGKSPMAARRCAREIQITKIERIV